MHGGTELGGDAAAAAAAPCCALLWPTLPAVACSTQVLGAPEAAATLAMNDRYFFQLLGRMAQDVGRQPEGDQRATLLAKLEGIQADAQQRAAGAEAEAAA